MFRVKVQRVLIPDKDEFTWVVLDDDYLPIDPIQQFLSYLRTIERSPNTIRSYAYHLRLYWEYLSESRLDWKSVGLTELADFVAWMRNPDPGVVHLQKQEAKRSESTVNLVITSVCMFYDYMERIGEADNIPIYRTQVQPGRRYKSFLHHINKGKPIRSKLIKIKEPKRIVKTISKDQVCQLIDACHRIRDQFLISLLYESGMRIGQALGLRLEDVHSWDNKIWVVPRGNNANESRAKTRETYSIDVSGELMKRYGDYLINEFGDCDSDYVFVNLWDGKIGHPMTYKTVSDLFRRLVKKTGIEVTPHILRHSHATELIRSGWNAAYVQKRLGHQNIQTVLNTYTHLDNEDMKQAYKEYQSRTLNESTTDSMV